MPNNAAERIELPGGMTWNAYANPDTQGTINFPDGRALAHGVERKRALEFAAAMNTPAEAPAADGLREALELALGIIQITHGKDARQVERAIYTALATPSPAAEIQLPPHKAAIADIQLAEHVFKLLKSYGVKIPEEKIPDFEMQLTYDMANFRGDFKGQSAEESGDAAEIVADDAMCALHKAGLIYGGDAEMQKQSVMDTLLPIIATALRAAKLRGAEAGLEAAAKAMSPMLRDMISRGQAVEAIRALSAEDVVAANDNPVPAQGGNNK